MAEVKFSLSMSDQLSGPVKNAASAVEQLIGSSKAAGSAVNVFGRQTSSAVEAIDGKISALVGKKIDIEFNSARLVGQTTAAMASIKAIDGQISGLSAKKDALSVEMGGEASAAIGRLDEQIAKLQGKKINIEVDVAKSKATNELLKLSGAGIESKIADLNSQKSSLMGTVSTEDVDAGWDSIEDAVTKSARQVKEFQAACEGAVSAKLAKEAQSLAEAEAKAAQEAKEWAAAKIRGGTAASKMLLNQQRESYLNNSLEQLASKAALSKVNAQLGGVSQSIFSKGIGWVGHTFGQETSDSVLGLAQGAARADVALQGMGMSLGGVVATGVGATVAAVGAVVVAAGAAVAAIGALTYKFVELGTQGAAAFTKFALASLSFRENTMVAFKTLTGTQELADDVYGKAVKFAAATPFNTDTVVGAYQKLLVGGFKVDELETMMNAIGDTAAMKGMNPQVIEQMVAGFAKMKGLGKLTGEVLDMEAFQGISGKIKEELGLQLGKSSDEIAKMIGGGKIDATTAQKAILEVIRKTYSGGTLGGAMADFSMTWEGMWSNLTSRPSELFQAASLEKDSGVQRMFGTLTKLGNVFVEALDPKSASGKKITGLINSVGDTLDAVYGKGIELAKVFWKSMEGSTGDKILGTFRDVGAAIKAAFGNIDSKSFGQWVDKWLPALVAGVGGFAKGLATSFGKFAELMKLDTGGDPEEMAKKFGKFAEQFGEAAGTLSFGILAIASAFGSLLGVMIDINREMDKFVGLVDGNGNRKTEKGGMFSPDIANNQWYKWAQNGILTSPTTVLPSGMDRNVQSSLDMSTPSSGGSKTQNNTISIQLSGVGLDLAQLADLIKRGVTDAMLQVVPA